MEWLTRMAIWNVDEMSLSSVFTSIIIPYPNTPTDPFPNTGDITAPKLSIMIICSSLINYTLFMLLIIIVVMWWLLLLLFDIKSWNRTRKFDKNALLSSPLPSSEFPFLFYSSSPLSSLSSIYYYLITIMKRMRWMEKRDEQRWVNSNEWIAT